jgi:hypothetical protein
MVYHQSARGSPETSILGCHECGNAVRGGDGLNIALEGPQLERSFSLTWCKGCSPRLMRKLSLPESMLRPMPLKDRKRQKR